MAKIMKIIDWIPWIKSKKWFTKRLDRISAELKKLEARHSSIMKELGWSSHLAHYELKDLEQMIAALGKDKPSNYMAQISAIQNAMEAVEIKRRIIDRNEKIKELLREMKNKGYTIPVPYDIWGF